MPHSAIILIPRLIAFDTSQLGGMIRDAEAEDSTRKKRVRQFLENFENAGNVILLTWHHLQELFSHADAALVEQRMRFLSSLPLVATIKAFPDASLPGSVIDLDAHEIAAAYHHPDARLSEVRDIVGQDLFRLDAGSALVRPFSDAWPQLSQQFAKQAARTREVVAISQSSFADIGHVRIGDLFGRPARTREAAIAAFAKLDARLAQDVRAKGDRRIADAGATSRAFLQDVARQGRNLPYVADPFFEILKGAGIELADIGPETTVADVGRLAAFRKRLDIANQLLDLPWGELKARLSPDRLPTSTLKEEIDRFRPSTAERKGSDLTDSYLACLSFYADVTFVDKRTLEALRQIRQKVPALGSLLRNVQKAGEYHAATLTF